MCRAMARYTNVPSAPLHPPNLSYRRRPTQGSHATPCQHCERQCCQHDGNADTCEGPRQARLSPTPHRYCRRAHKVPTGAWSTDGAAARSTRQSCSSTHQQIPWRRPVAASSRPQVATGHTAQPRPHHHGHGTGDAHSGLPTTENNEVQERHLKRGRVPQVFRRERRKLVNRNTRVEEIPLERVLVPFSIPRHVDDNRHHEGLPKPNTHRHAHKLATHHKTTRRPNDIPTSFTGAEGVNGCSFTDSWNRNGLAKPFLRVVDGWDAATRAQTRERRRGVSATKAGSGNHCGC